MQNKKNSKIISKLVLSTTAAFMATMAVKATEEPNDVQSQVENFQQEDQLQVAYAKVSGSLPSGHEEGDSTANDYGVVYDSNTGNVVGYTDNIKDNVTIASGVGASDAVPVTAIAGEATEGDKTGAFSGCDKLVSVEIPSTVTDIGQNAFYNCEKLEYIKINNKDIVLENSIVSGNTDVKIVYVAEGANSNNIKKYTDADEVRIIETSLVPPGSASGKIESVTATDNSITIKWKHVGGTEMYAISRKIGSGASSTIGVYHVPAGTEADTVLEFVDKNEDKKVEFGKKCTYTVTPYNLHDEYKNVTLENFKTYSNDPFGMKTNTGGSQEFTYDEFKKNGVTSYYTTVDVGSDSDTTTIDGSYATFSNGLTRNVYSLQGNAYGIAKPDTSTNFKWEDGTATSHQALLYVREWDIENKDKTEWDKNAGAENKGASRVFSLQVLKDENNDGELTTASDYLSSGNIGYNCASKMVSGDHDTTAKNFTMYVEMDESWGNDVSVYAIRKDDTDIKLTSKIVDSANGIKGRFLEVTLGEFYYGPYAIYADKLENAGTNNSELCETCGKQKDECTCEKKDEETKPEDTTKEDNKNNASGTNGTQTGGNTSSGTSHGYKTGDVASAGLLQSAFGMLAAAGSTLMGLFRKKKDRE